MAAMWFSSLINPRLQQFQKRQTGLQPTNRSRGSATSCPMSAMTPVLAEIRRELSLSSSDSERPRGLASSHLSH